MAKHRAEKGDFQFQVTVKESEAGWGQRWEYDLFDTLEEAERHRDRINSYNTAPTAPSWYMQAEQEIKVVARKEKK